MFKKTSAILLAVCVLVISGFPCGRSVKGQSSSSGGVIETDIVSVSVEQKYESVRPGSRSALAVRFELKKDWHFYASPETSPGGINLKVKAAAKNHIIFSEPIFPPSHIFFDTFSNEKIEVFSDKFTVFMPFSVSGVDLEAGKSISVAVKIGIDGAVCSGAACQFPDYPGLETTVKVDADATMSAAKFALPDLTEEAPKSETVPASQWADYSVWFALGLAFLAGLSLNIMPCVWPVLPIIVMRLVEQAKQDRGKSIVMGLAFCLGILLFFVCLAGANIILQLFYGTVLQWGDQLRNPTFVTVLAMVLIVLALFMFDVFSFVLPGSISGKSSSSYAGTIGMGFLAAVLSTPCSFGILAAAFAWAQGQPLIRATVAIMVIGVGMALPYLILVSIPGLLDSLPKPGKWMDIFKKTVGFILLGIAVWMITVLSQERRIGLLYYSVILSFCVWMWGGWVSFDSKTSKKIIVRTIAVLLAVIAGFRLLSAPTALINKEAKPKPGIFRLLFPPTALINWKGYDADLIEESLTDNKPVLIKFTAEWCLSCKVVEKLVFERKDIAELIKEKGVLAIKADTTTRDLPATLALKSLYNEPGVPVSILFLPSQEEPVRWRGKDFGDELKSLLEKLP